MIFEFFFDFRSFFQVYPLASRYDPNIFQDMAFTSYIGAGRECKREEKKIFFCSEIIPLLYIELSGKRRVSIKVENWQSRQFSWIFNQNQHISRLEQCKLFVILDHCQSGLALNCLPTYIHACNARKREFKRYVNFWVHLKGCRLISARSTV